MTKSIGFLRTTAIGGLVFLLPLIVIGVLLGKVSQVVLVVAGILRDTLGIETAYGYFVLLIAAVALVLLLCFAAGLAAQLAISRRLGEFVEKHLTLIFPRYSIYKDQVSGGIGGEFAKSRLKPVLVEMIDTTRIAFEVERSDELVTLYLPSSPDPWAGHVGFVTVDRVKPIEGEVGDVMATFERLGRDSLCYVNTLKPTEDGPATRTAAPTPPTATDG
ncbi:DUF502 domain-containing protein [Stratiformator vulcanicus]|uniref:DUF502 domain-containing protein n=1 Tax=Stratiformator vulcanicus TaxID=2527980 RepID=UPI00287730DA|nr:DUF502 domain-containing protein [Stratiformator vulcanicus]